MRFLSALLAIYFLALSLCPCADSENMVYTAQQINITAAGHNDAGHQHRDTCSPLCSCSCCGVNVLVTQPMLISPVSRVLRWRIPVWNNAVLLFHSIVFWKPPKIA